MKRTLSILALVLCFLNIDAQIFKSTSTDVSFFSETPLENIEAKNTLSGSMINIKDKQLVFQIPIKAFKFKKDLMEEHFNENYLESEKYPKASFNGNFNEDVDLTVDGTYELTATGILLVHGVEQERTLSGTLIRKGDEISLTGTFQIMLEDHKIKIPKVVIANIAEVIDVKVAATYKPYVKKK
ncbi:MAG: YceI family protein [Flavobacteriales bacterium]|nr:YceI family protein [Flavobacteriales bacterium]